MKFLMRLVMVLVIGIFVTTVSNMALAQEKKGPVGKVVSAAMDTTKKVGTVAGDTVSAVSDTTATATKGVTGAADDAVSAVSGDTAGTASDTTTTATKGVVGVAGDAVQAVSDTTDKAVTGILK